MSIIINIALQLLIIFIGFAIGRLGDKYFGYLHWAPHHWMWGVLLIIIGLILRNSLLGIGAISFGIGHFVSDLNDFLHMRFFGKEPPHKWKFWNID